MATVINNRVRETTTTQGTGTVDLAGAVAGHQSFVDGIGNGVATYYVITDGTNWEVGRGTVTSGSPSTLSRTTILESSNADAAVNFPAGTKDVFCDMPAEKVIFKDENGIVVNTEQVAFRAVNSIQDDNQTGNGATITVDVDTESFDQNADFASDTFTAPVAGKYFLGGKIGVTGLSGLGATALSADLVCSTLGNIRVAHMHPGNYAAAAATIVVPFLEFLSLSAGETVSLSLTISNGSGNTADITTNTCLFGFLVA